MSTTFFVLGFACIIGGIVSAIALTEYIRKRGLKVNYWLIRFLIFRYLAQYKEITVKENGYPGPWYSRYIGCMLGAMGFVIIGVILRQSGM